MSLKLHLIFTTPYVQLGLMRYSFDVLALAGRAGAQAVSTFNQGVVSGLLRRMGEC